MEHNNEQKTQKITVNIAPEIAKGIYSNFFTFMLSKNEVVIDFGLSLPKSHINNVNINSRVIMSKDSAKKFLSTMQNAILDQESKQNDK